VRLGNLGSEPASVGEGDRQRRRHRRHNCDPCRLHSRASESTSPSPTRRFLTDPSLVKRCASSFPASCTLEDSRKPAAKPGPMRSPCTFLQRPGACVRTLSRFAILAMVARAHLKPDFISDHDAPLSFPSRYPRSGAQTVRRRSLSQIRGRFGFSEAMA